MGTMHGTKIQYAEHFSMGTLHSIFHKIIDDGLFKGLLAMLAVGFHWVFDGRKEALFVIGALIAIDTVTGAAKAWKKGTMSSSGFFRSVVKLLVYFLLMATAGLVDKVMPIPFASVIMDTFLAATEAISIMENLSALGFAVPVHLIKRLKLLRQQPPAEEAKKEDNDPKAG